MASILKLKRSNTAGATPSLVEGELAINIKDEQLFNANSSATFAFRSDGSQRLGKTTGEFGERQLTQTVVTSVNYYANATVFVGGTLWNQKLEPAAFNSALANTNAFIVSAFGTRDGGSY